MRDFPASPTSRREVNADSGALWRTLFHLWPYIWPTDRQDLKNRVIMATLLLFAAKLATIAVPFTFKWATDALAGHGTAPVGPDDVLAWHIGNPVIGSRPYGGSPIVRAGRTRAGRGLVPKVELNWVRRFA